MDSSAGPLNGRPYGGLGILRRKTLGNICTIKTVNDDRLLVLEQKANGKVAVLVNVSISHDDGTNPDSYQSYLSKLENIVSDNSYSCAIGDFNANVSHGGHRFGKELVNFCKEENFIITDKVLAASDCFTFVSSAHETVSWIDHIVSTHSLHSLIDRVWVDYPYISSDHLPLFACMNIADILLIEDSGQNSSQVTQRIQWDEVPASNIQLYTSQSKHSLK